MYISSGHMYIKYVYIICIYNMHIYIYISSNKLHVEEHCFNMVLQRSVQIDR